MLGLPQTARGEVIVNHDLSVAAHPEVFVIGDLAATTDRGGRPYPQLAPVAMQQARHVARSIVRRRVGKKTRRFRYVDKGTMATIGRRSAVAELPLRIHFGGTLGWLSWLGSAPRVPRRVPQPSRGVRQLGVELPHLGPREPDHHPAGLT